MAGSQTPELAYTGMTPSAPQQTSDPGSRSGVNTYAGSASRKVEFVSFAAPATVGGRNLVVQLSWQNLFDLDLGMDHHRTLAYPASGMAVDVKEGIAQTGRMGQLTGSLAYELSPRILAGVSYNRWSGHWTYASDYDITLTMPAGTAYQVGTVRTGSTFEGQNYNLGLMWRTEPLKIGLTYRTPFTARFEVDGGLYAPNTEPSLATPERLRIHWPWTLGAGVAWRVVPQLQLALDWSRTPWSHTTFEAPGSSLDQRNFFNPFAPAGSGEARQILQVADATTWRLGGEYLFFWGRRIVPVRAGWFREPQPVFDNRTGEQRVLKGFTLGVGLKQGALAFDLAFKRATGARSASVPEDPFSGFVDLAGDGYDKYYNFTGREEVTITQLKASVIYQFKGEGLRAFFRKVLIGE